MNENYIVILPVIIPLLSSILNIFLSILGRKYCYPFLVLSQVLMLFYSGKLFLLINREGPLSYYLGGWPPPIGIEYYVDYLNSYIIFIIAFFSVISSVYFKDSIKDEVQESKIPLLISTYLLFISGLIGISITGDIFNLFVFLEIASLSGYALIALGEKRAILASFNYLILGTIGASFYLLGVGYIYMMTGSLNINELKILLNDLSYSSVIQVAICFIIVGLGIKISLFPLHVWLPNAYTYAPSVITVISASTVTKVGIYAIVRMFFDLFGLDFFLINKFITKSLNVWAVVATLCASILALKQRDFKKTLCYILIAEIGYMIIGISLLNKEGYVGSIYHILVDATIMACFFMIIGGLYKIYNRRDYTIFDSLYYKMPLLSFAFIINSISLLGIPPTAGFFTKWYLILGSIKSENIFSMISIIVSSLINAFIIVNLIKRMFFTRQEGQNRDNINVKLPLSMLIPIFFLSILSIFIGLFSDKLINIIIKSSPFN